MEAVILFFTGGAGLLVVTFCGLTGYTLKDALHYVSQRRQVRLARRFGRSLTRPEGANARRVEGREDDVAALTTLLETAGKGAIVPVPTIVGGGGVGKTTLARHYARCRATDYDRTEELRAGTEADLIDSLAALGDRLLGPAPTTPPRDRAIQTLEAITDRCRREKWLIILDNVETPQTLHGWLPRGRRLHVLLTTRHPDWTGEGFVTHRAQVLSPAAAVRLLERESGRNDADLGALAADLGHLPLALVQAGDWLAGNPQASVADYRRRLDALLDDWPRAPGEIADYDRTTAATFRLTLQRLGPDALAVLGVFARLAPDGLAPDILERAGQLPWRARLSEQYRPVPWRVWAVCRAPQRRAAALDDLRRHALVEESLLVPGTLAMHRVAQRVVRRALGRRAGAAAAAALLAAAYPGNPNASATWPLFRRLTPHVLALLDSDESPTTDAMGYLCNEAAIYLLKVGDHAGGLVLARAGLAITEARRPESHRDFAAGLANLGAALESAGQLAEAEALLARAVALDEAHRPGSADLANRYGIHGSVLQAFARSGDAPRFAEAENRFRQAVDLHRRLSGDASLGLARALNNLGSLRHELGHGAEAAELFQQELDISRRALPPGDARIASGAMNTGSSWLESGRADLAEPLLDEALAILERELADYPAHRDRRTAADWLVSCLLVRAAAGEDPGPCRARAQALCAAYGFDLAQQQAQARNYPYTPPA